MRQKALTREEYTKFQKKFAGFEAWFKEALKRSKNGVSIRAEEIQDYDELLRKAATPARRSVTDISGVKRWLTPPTVSVKKENYYKRERAYLRSVMGLSQEGGVSIESADILVRLNKIAQKSRKDERKEEKKLENFIEQSRHILNGLSERFKAIVSPTPPAIESLFKDFVTDKYIEHRVAHLPPAMAKEAIEKALVNHLDSFDAKEHAWIKAYSHSSVESQSPRGQKIYIEEPSEDLRLFAENVYNTVKKKQKYGHRLEVEIPESLISVLKQWQSKKHSKLSVEKKKGIPHLRIISLSPYDASVTLADIAEIDSELESREQQDDFFNWAYDPDGSFFQLQNDLRWKLSAERNK